MNFSTWSINDYAAWWGAVIATLVLILNVITLLLSGPRIRVRASPNMQIFPQNTTIGENKTYILITVTNRGNSATTLTHFHGYYANNLWNLLRKKKRIRFVLPVNLLLGKVIPYVFASGEEWSNMVEQSDIQKDLGNGYLYIGVSHSQNNRPTYVRVRLNSQQSRKLRKQ